MGAEDILLLGDNLVPQGLSRVEYRCYRAQLLEGRRDTAARSRGFLYCRDSVQPCLPYDLTQHFGCCFSISVHVCSFITPQTYTESSILDPTLGRMGANVCSPTRTGRQSQPLPAEVLRRAEYQKPLKAAETPWEHHAEVSAICLEAAQREKDKSQTLCVSA